MTPHIEAKKEDIAKTVIMPGDPLRCKMIAEKYLENYKLVNKVRNQLAYTGTYKGKKVTIFSSGMGNPSMGIYSYELYTEYDVDTIIRVGTCGAYREDVKVRDIVVAMGACSNSNYASQFNLNGTFAPIASFDLLNACHKVCQDKKVNAHFGNVFSSDTFYNDTNSSLVWNKMGVLAVEMESAGLYLNAMRYGKNALCICTISDSLVTGEELSSEERQTSFHEMMLLALELA